MEEAGDCLLRNFERSLRRSLWGTSSCIERHGTCRCDLEDAPSFQEGVEATIVRHRLFEVVGGRGAREQWDEEGSGRKVWAGWAEREEGRQVSEEGQEALGEVSEQAEGCDERRGRLGERLAG
jgi:hypothetical protein